MNFPKWNNIFIREGEEEKKEISLYFAIHDVIKII